MSTTEPTERAIGIVRVSQRDGDNSEHSPEVQIRAMVKHADDNEYALDPRDIHDENVDTNGRVRKVSGSWDLSDRPKLAAAIEAVERGTHRVILAERFDRLFRNLDVQREAIQRVERAGGRFETIKQGAISHATAEAELHANLDGVIAQYQRRTAKERSRDGVAIAVEEGHWIGPVPPGYRKGEDGRLEVDAAVEPIVVKAFELRAAREPYSAVRRYLAANGIERTVSGTRAMLRSKAYIGEINFGPLKNPKAHDPIIERELFAKVQRTSSSAGRKAKSERLLARLGVLRCGSCGGRMSAQMSAKDFPTYRCTSQACEKPQTISAELAEAYVVGEVKAARADAKARASADEHYQHAIAMRDHWEAERKRRLRIAMATDSGDEPEVIATINEATAERDRWQVEVDRLAPVQRGRAVSLTADWDDLTLAERRDLIVGTIENVTVTPGRGIDRLSRKLLGE